MSKTETPADSSAADRSAGNANRPHRPSRLALQHPLIAALIGLRGNARACVLTEPLWGIPYNLYTPFFTVYLYSLGVQDTQIGLLLSIGLVCQVVTAFLGGILTDYFGRRLTVMVFDLFGWSVPLLIWIFARNFWWFLAAAILNSLWQIPMTAWNCLVVEDADPASILPIFTWITISGLLAVFFAPLSGLLVSWLGIVPAVRIILVLAFVMITYKAFLLYRISHETTQGLVRMQAIRRTRPAAVLTEYKPLIRQLLGRRSMVTILGIMVVIQITGSVTGSFLGLYATENLGIPAPWLSAFPMLRAAVMLVFFFTIQTRLSRRHLYWQLSAGLFLAVISQLLLISAAGHRLALVLYLLTDALAYTLVVPQKDSLLALGVEPAERARLTSLLYIFMIALAAPFGWIAGLLSAHERSWPFILNLGFYLAGLVLVGLSRHQAAVKASDADNPASGLASGH